MEKLKYERPIINKLQAGMPDKFGMNIGVKVISNIDGIPVSEIIDTYGSPTFVLSEQTIRDTFQEANEAFTTRYPKVQFAWSYKTNYLNAVCKIYHDEGSWAEVVSGFEYDKAIGNGVKGSNIIFNGPDKSDKDLEKAIENDSFIHIDHFDELYSLIKITSKSNKKAKVAIRVNMDTGIYPQWDRFGFNYENGDAWKVLNKIMLADHLELVGLHTHIGTYILTPNAYGVAASKLSELAVRVYRKFNHIVSYIDMGGGFASDNTLKGAYLPGKDTCPSFDDYAESITNALINSEIPPENLPTLILETGRALIDDAGYLVGTVLANKRLVSSRRATIIDIGINLLFTSFWYEHEIYPVKQVSEQTEDTTIYGPLCMNIDVVRSAVKFPLLQKGDHVIIPRVGAYNMTQWMQFITLRPNIVLIDTDKKMHIIREKETNETFNTQERLPKHLS
ncbi:MAG TPA: diaminopimelate decarboxylase [Lutibacter sp.]|nr:diaminopimelate decarboxylase [Lutibacter sp.]